METVFDGTESNGKATSIELAARLDISREEVLNELWELKKAGFVDKSAYTWRVADKQRSAGTASAGRTAGRNYHGNSRENFRERFNCDD